MSRDPRERESREASELEGGERAPAPGADATEDAEEPIAPDEIDEVAPPDGDDDGDEPDDGAPARLAPRAVHLPVLVEATTAPLPLPMADTADFQGGDTLTRYMAQLRHHAPISREEEHELAVRWREHGDVEAARRLVVSNLRLVFKIAMEYRRAWTNALDLIQEGNVGLMEAVQRFDPYQGVKLSTYAVYWIRAYVLKYILDNMRSVRMGTTRAQRKLFYRLNRERRELERQGFEVTPKLIAERLEVSEQDVEEMQARLSRPDLSMDAPIGDEDGSATYGDFMSAGGPSAERQVGDDELRGVFAEQIAEFKKTLAARDLQILEERVLAEEPRTLADLGEEYGITRERVRQLEARLVKRLRDHMKQALVDFEYYAPDADA
ncbi:MAG: RNA polymerase factor sigma-32 [Myxococcota bacterium]